MSLGPFPVNRTERCALPFWLSRVFSAFCISLGVLTACATDGPNIGRLDFPTQILPLLTKAGCNSGACHGAAVGQGGFRLSLLGYDPESDYEAITRELEGRRIDLATPARSLVLLKPTRQIEHEGGRRIKRDSEACAKIADWIASGAPYGNRSLRVERIEVQPSDVLLERTNSTFRIRVTALLSDGGQQEVSGLALYSSNDDSLAEVDNQGAVTVRRRGVTAIMVRYSGQVAAVRVAVPFQETPLDKIEFATRTLVDEWVLKELKRLRLPPSPLSNDSEFYRRIHLDLIGALPTEADVRAFLNSPRDAAARERVIDDLLASDGFIDFWTMKLADLLLIHSKRLGDAPARAYYSWLRRHVASNTPLDKLVSELLTAQGNAAEYGPANFHRLKQDPRDMADYASRALLGIRVACARCHNHPTDRWTQEDYHRFAAYFARTTVDGQTVSLNTHGEVLHPKTNQRMNAKPLGASEPSELPSDRRAHFAEWLRSNENRALGRALVNRVWKELMGRGLIEPVDDLRVTNPASNPALLEALVSDFIKGGYDLRRLVRTIAASRTYQLSSRANEVNRLDDRLFASAYAKPLSAQVLADAVSQATGIAGDYSGYPEGTRAVQLLDPAVQSYALDVFGRCEREAVCESAGQSGGGLSQALHLINGPTINGKLKQAVAKYLDANRPMPEIITSFYFATMGRSPESHETAQWETLVATSDRAEALEDLLWALLNSREFAYNH
ncbi:MAG: DUF1549 domain-containing protein [Verrucomicrobia bacterium]|nr:DUF1549 domain-containing protein [Verrucomicrobiota bacterium]